MPINLTAYAEGFRRIKLYFVARHQLRSCIDLILLERQVIYVVAFRDDDILARLEVRLFFVRPSGAHSVEGIVAVESSEAWQAKSRQEQSAWSFPEETEDLYIGFPCISGEPSVTTDKPDVGTCSRTFGPPSRGLWTPVTLLESVSHG